LVGLKSEGAAGAGAQVRNGKPAAAPLRLECASRRWPRLEAADRGGTGRDRRGMPQGRLSGLGRARES